VRRWWGIAGCGCGSAVEMVMMVARTIKWERRIEVKAVSFMIVVLGCLSLCCKNYVLE
jgi:hypothetical protein